MKKIDQSNTDYWDKVYSGEPYQDRITEDRQFWKKMLDMVIDHNKTLLIVEYGCGIGDYTDYLRQKKHVVIGTDYSSEAIKQCKSRYPSSVYQQADIRNSNIMGKKDIIIAFEMLEHLHPSEIEIVLFRIKKQLRRNGKFIFSLPHVDGRFGRMPEHYTEWDCEKIYDLFSRYWNKISFYKVNPMCNKLNIFCVAENITGDKQ